MEIPGCPPVNVKTHPDNEKGLILRADDVDLPEKDSINTDRIVVDRDEKVRETL